MALAQGTRLGPYQVVSPLGAGGMGEVYRATDTRLGRDVAIKVLPESFASDSDRLRRFEQEARAVAALNHANILGVYDVGEYGGSPYLVTELLEGEPLRAKMSDGPIAQRRVLEYAAQIAEGLAAAHDKGIIHRDLKPENIFLTRDGRVKILDFGLAKLVRAESAVAAAETRTIAVGTSVGVALGTAGYMSPEQVRGKEVDARTDIFAFGTILYEMLSGRRAFHGESSVETMNAILKEEPPELEAERLHVSPALERLIRRCLEKEPDRRFRSARDVGFALEAIGSSSSSTGSRAALQAPPPSRARLGAWIAATLAIAVVSFYAATRLAPSAPTIENRFQLLTFRPQIIFHAAFAPDGKSIIFSSAFWANRPDIYILSTEYPEPRPTELKNTQLLSVSSKGELAVLRNPHLVGHQIFEGMLARVAMGGSAPREIQENVMEADWNPDGSDLAITRVVDGKCRLEYPIGKVLAETNGYFSDLRFSPKGDHIAFFEHPIRFDDRGTVATVDLSGNKKILSDEFWGEEGLVWNKDGNEILFSAGTGSYSSFPVRGVTLEGRSRIVLDSAGGLWIRDIATDGRWLATQEQQWRDMQGLGPDTKSEVNLAFLDFSQPNALSADGRTLLFTEENSFFGGNYSVCIRKTDGSPAVVLGEGQSADLSPDGTMALALLFKTPNKLMVYPTGAGKPRELQLGAITNLENARWLDNNRAMVCGSEQGHGSRCYVVNLSGGKPTPITPEGTTGAIPVPDGKSILAIEPDGSRSFYPLDGGKPHPLSVLQKERLSWYDTVLGWTNDHKGLIVRVQDGQAATLIQRLDLVTGKRILLRRLAPADPSGLLAIQYIAVADDAKYYAYAYRRQRSALFLVKNSN